MGINNIRWVGRIEVRDRAIDVPTTTSSYVLEGPEYPTKTPVRLQTPTPNPLANQWWPGPWGQQDEQGASRRITPAKVLEAAKLIKRGKIYPLGRVLEKGIPVFGERLGSHVVIPGTPTGGPFGKHQLYYRFC